MADIIDENGLQVETASEITAKLVSALQIIYGADINVAQNSRDGQLVGIITQIAVDYRELLEALNNSFDPDLATGILLDQRVALNNIQRAGGTYTAQPINITVDRTLTLAGLDANFNNPNGVGYTVQDNSGNQFILIDSATIAAGVHALTFRAKQIGEINVPINTITSPVTIIAGVTVINNGSAAVSIGQNQESDAQLRTRRQQSVANSSAGYLNGLLGVVLALTGVTSAVLYENVSDTTDGNGIPPHAIWLIVEGGANSDIANAIYVKKSYGANMKGAVSVNIITASGALFVAKFDRPTAVDLYIKFTIQTTVLGYSFDTGAIADYIAANLKYAVGQFSETSRVTDAALAGIASQGGGGVPVLVQISDDGITYTDYLPAPTLDSEWTLDALRVDITVVP